MKVFVVVIIAVFALWSCSKGPAPASQQATVTLNDGSTFSGTVTSSSAAAISLQAANGEARTYPMSQVASVQYGQPAPSAQAVNQPPVASPAPAPAPPETAPPPAAPPAPVAEVRTIPAGTAIQVRNNQTIDSQTAQVGQTFPGVIAREIRDNHGQVAIPRGATATLVVRSASGQGKLQGQSDLVVDVSSVVVKGRRYRLETSDFAQKGKEGVGTNKRTGEFVGGGAALGGIIGAIAGGGKGAAIGALSGAGAGTATQGITRGKAVRIPSETLLRFQLEAPVTIHELPR